MPIYQSVIFQECGDQGWSNVFYVSASDHPAALAIIQALNTRLLDCQGDPVLSVAVRVSDVQVRGDGLAAAPTTTSGTLSTAGTKMADLNECVHLYFTDATFVHRVHHYVHGLRVVDVDKDGSQRTVLTALYKALPAVATLVAYIEANTVNWQRRTIPPITAALTTSDVRDRTSIRRVGRPFGLPVGRHRTA